MSGECDRCGATICLCDEIAAYAERRKAEYLIRLRDSFALRILPSIYEERLINVTLDNVAADVWLMADAMLKARGR